MPSSRTPRVPSRVARRGVLAAGALAALMAAFILAGILLPGSVEVERSVEIAASPERVFPFLDDLEAWELWTPWGDVEWAAEGPRSGPGARRTWDDPQLGSGSFSIVSADFPSEVAYLVEVEDGAIRFEGALSVRPRGDGALVTWRERADLGWNPLLGWTALGMEDSQGGQLEESLARLKEAVEAEADEPEAVAPR